MTIIEVTCRSLGRWCLSLVTNVVEDIVCLSVSFVVFIDAAFSGQVYRMEKSLIPQG